jgi:predicted transcriptional regulator
VPNGLWASRQVADVMQTAVDQLIVGPDISTMQAMEMMVTRGADQLIVVQDDLVLGLLTRASIGQFIELHQPRR